MHFYPFCYVSWKRIIKRFQIKTLWSESMWNFISIDFVMFNERKKFLENPWFKSMWKFTFVHLLCMVIKRNISKFKRNDMNLSWNSLMSILLCLVWEGEIFLENPCFQYVYNFIFSILLCWKKDKSSLKTHDLIMFEFTSISIMLCLVRARYFKVM
jgi:hypothetical protein